MVSIEAFDATTYGEPTLAPFLLDRYRAWCTSPADPVPGLQTRVAW